MTVWLVRAGKHGEREAFALEKGLAVIGWDQLPDLSKLKAREELEALLVKTYPDAKPKTLANHAGQIWAFVSRIKEGDLVVLPLKNRAGIAIGRVQGPYSFKSDHPEGSRHTRPVEWVKKDIPRSAFDQDILYSFGAFMTVCQIQRNNAEDRIKAVLEGKGTPTKPLKVAPAAPQEAVEAEAAPNLDEIARDQVVQLINQRFKGHELTRLVAAILDAQGYQTEVSPPGADKGVDIVAGRGPMGFDAPRIAVQVKSGDGTTDSKTVTELQGAMKKFGASQGLFVSWAGFKQSVNPRELFFDIRLWDADTLVEELLQNYEKLSKDVQAEIPLKRIWTLIQED